MHSGIADLAPWSQWAALSDAQAPKLRGVYLARQGQAGPLVYVGMAGERSGKGIRGRLQVYTGKGLSSGLGEAAFDRALADPAWLRLRLAEVDAGTPMRARDWARAALARADLYVCWSVTADEAAAQGLETRVIQTIRASGEITLWNRA